MRKTRGHFIYEGWYKNEKEKKRHQNTPTKNAKGEMGVEYQVNPKLRSRAETRRTEGIKLKLTELRTVTGKHCKIMFYDEKEDFEPEISTCESFATSMALYKEDPSYRVDDISSQAEIGSHASKNSETSKRLVMSPCASKTSVPRKGRTIYKNKCAVCGVIYDSQTDKALSLGALNRTFDPIFPINQTRLILRDLI